ncbi:MAG: ABC transporter ATP-binding protein [Eubacterium sp.]|nr:ABC transporter ATP-binding protein [Eubacterium sp.]
MMGNIVELSGLSKAYGKKKVVDDFSLKLRKGHICGLIGPNGAGKTTIMRMMAGLSEPDAGEMKYFGSKDLDQMRSRMSFIIEEPFMDMNMTARENMEYIRILRGIPNEKRIDEMLDFVKLSDTGKKVAGNFSLGMRQRLGLAMALLSKPDIMVLDEPINGLDPEGIVDIRKMLQYLSEKEKISILISSHILKELSELCTDYVIINRGKKVEELSNEELLTKTSSYIALKTNDINRTATVLEDILSIKNYKVSHENEIYIYEGYEDIEKISRTVSDNGVTITRLNLEGENLEDYYMRKVGDNNE